MNTTPVKLYQTDGTFLRPEFVCRLKQEARKYALIEQAKSKKEWLFGELANAEWNALAAEDKEEITIEHFYVEVSHAINDGLPFPIVGESGQTLRRWCEVARSYVNMPEAALFREILSFDHFFQARRMAYDERVTTLTHPVVALAEAVRNKWVVKEMVQHYDPPHPQHEYDQVMGWLASMQAVKLQWVKNAEERKQALYHLAEYARIVERYK